MLKEFEGLYSRFWRIQKIRQSFYVKEFQFDVSLCKRMYVKIFTILDRVKELS
jgi:hypothetical protein